VPIYEYRCNNCGRIQEFLVMGGKEIDIACPDCGSRDMERLLSLASFINAETSRLPGKTCCGRDERCESPPCSTGGRCRRDRL